MTAPSHRLPASTQEGIISRIWYNSINLLGLMPAAFVGLVIYGLLKPSLILLLDTSLVKGQYLTPMIISELSRVRLGIIAVYSYLYSNLVLFPLKILLANLPTKADFKMISSLASHTPSWLLQYRDLSLPKRIEFLSELSTAKRQWTRLVDLLFRARDIGIGNMPDIARPATSMINYAKSAYFKIPLIAKLHFFIKRYLHSQLSFACLFISGTLAWWIVRTLRNMRLRDVLYSSGALQKLKEAPDESALEQGPGRSKPDLYSLDLEKIFDPVDRDRIRRNFHSVAMLESFASYMSYALEFALPGWRPVIKIALKQIALKLIYPFSLIPRPVQIFDQYILANFAKKILSHTPERWVQGGALYTNKFTQFLSRQLGEKAMPYILDKLSIILSVGVIYNVAIPVLCPSMSIFVRLSNILLIAPALTMILEAVIALDDGYGSPYSSKRSVHVYIAPGSQSVDSSASVKVYSDSRGAQVEVGELWENLILLPYVEHLVWVKDPSELHKQVVEMVENPDIFEQPSSANRWMSYKLIREAEPAVEFFTKSWAVEKIKYCVANYSHLLELSSNTAELMIRLRGVNEILGTSVRNSTLMGIIQSRGDLLDVLRHISQREIAPSGALSMKEILATITTSSFNDLMGYKCADDLFLSRYRKEYYKLIRELLNDPAKFCFIHLYGEPGSGKTYSANLVATLAYILGYDSCVIDIKCQDLMKDKLNALEVIGQAFERAKLLRKMGYFVVVRIDELSTFVEASQDTEDGRSAVNGLKKQIEGLVDKEPVIGGEKVGKIILVTTANDNVKGSSTGSTLAHRDSAYGKGMDTAILSRMTHAPVHLQRPKGVEFLRALLSNLDKERPRGLSINEDHGTIGREVFILHLAKYLDEKFPEGFSFRLIEIILQRLRSQSMVQASVGHHILRLKSEPIYEKMTYDEIATAVESVIIHDKDVDAQHELRPVVRRSMLTSEEQIDNFIKLYREELIEFVKNTRRLRWENKARYTEAIDRVTNGKANQQDKEDAKALLGHISYPDCVIKLKDGYIKMIKDRQNSVRYSLGKGEVPDYFTKSEHSVELLSKDSWFSNFGIKLTESEEQMIGVMDEDKIKSRLLLLREEFLNMNNKLDSQCILSAARSRVIKSILEIQGAINSQRFRRKETEIKMKIEEVSGIKDLIGRILTGKHVSLLEIGNLNAQALMQASTDLGKLVNDSNNIVLPNENQIMIKMVKAVDKIWKENSDLVSIDMSASLFSQLCIEGNYHSKLRTKILDFMIGRPNCESELRDAYISSIAMNLLRQAMKVVEQEPLNIRPPHPNKLQSQGSQAPATQSASGASEEVTSEGVGAEESGSVDNSQSGSGDSAGPAGEDIAADDVVEIESTPYEAADESEDEDDPLVFYSITTAQQNPDPASLIHVAAANKPEFLARLKNLLYSGKL